MEFIGFIDNLSSLERVSGFIVRELYKIEQFQPSQINEKWIRASDLDKIIEEEKKKCL